MAVKILESAFEDLQLIKEWHYKNGSKIATGCLEEIERLNQSPNIGVPLDSKIDVETDFKFLVYRPYLIFYKVRDKVVVYRIMDGRQDYLGNLLATKS
ncbi:type II toxin-antitoxin system RelE/ParE family toxin [Pseudolactococcus yaeyamensis]